MCDEATAELCGFRNIDDRGGGCAAYGVARMHRLLFIEDDDQIRLALRLALEDEGYVVEEAGDGRTGLAAFDRDEPDLVIVDLRLPDIQGFDVCRTIRAKSIVPIMIVTAQTDTYDLVAGLEAGADDYVTKPVVPKELAARIRALLRRTRAELDGDRLGFNGLELDTDLHGARFGEQVVELTRTEYQLLELLMLNPRRILPHSLIYERVWGYDFGPSSNALRVYIGYLRRKLSDLGAPDVIHNVRGVGYVLREAGS